MPTQQQGAIWVVVADSARARIFRAESPTAVLHEQEVMANPEARQPGRDLVTDDAGRAFSRVGEHHATMGREPEAKEHEIERFAHQLAQRLNEARVQHALAHLVLVAPPAFLGVLRQQLDPHVAALVVHSIDKDLSQLRADELRQRLPPRLI
jgi:protein required for attachment to host cells